MVRADKRKSRAKTPAVAKPRTYAFCTNMAVAGSRFCTHHETAMVLEMSAAGYLTPRPYSAPFRSWEKRENTHDTKYGRDR